jgi:hypothetical protein
MGDIVGRRHLVVVDGGVDRDEEDGPLARPPVHWRMIGRQTQVFWGSRLQGERLALDLSYPTLLSKRRDQGKGREASLLLYRQLKCAFDYTPADSHP